MSCNNELTEVWYGLPVDVLHAALRPRRRFSDKNTRALPSMRLHVTSQCLGPLRAPSGQLRLDLAACSTLARVPCPGARAPSHGCTQGCRDKGASGAPQGLAAPLQALRVHLRPIDEGAERLRGGLRRHHERGGDRCVPGRNSVPGAGLAGSCAHRRPARGEAHDRAQQGGESSSTLRQPFDSARP